MFRDTETQKLKTKVFLNSNLRFLFYQTHSEISIEIDQEYYFRNEYSVLSTSVIPFLSKSGKTLYSPYYFIKNINNVNGMRSYQCKKINVDFLSDRMFSSDIENPPFLVTESPAVPNQRAKGKVRSAKFFPGTVGLSSTTFNPFLVINSEYKSASLEQ